MKVLDTWPTPNFKEGVIDRPPDLDTAEAPSADAIVEQLTGVTLPKESEERQKALVRAYTAPTELYSRMNRALLDDDIKGITYFGAYIKELRDVFKTDHVDQIITPFTGTVWRGIRFDDIKKALEDYPPGKEFVWAAFNSFSTDKNVAVNFAGGGGSGVLFRVKCCPPPNTYDDDTPEYAPADIQSWSYFGNGEAEILFPCNIKMRVLKITEPTGDMPMPQVYCTTIGLDTDDGVTNFHAAQERHITVLQDQLDVKDMDMEEVNERLRDFMSNQQAMQEQIYSLQQAQYSLQQAQTSDAGSALQSKVAELEQQNSGLVATVAQLQMTVANLQSTVSCLQLMQMQMRSPAQPAVAFRQPMQAEAPAQPSVAYRQPMQAEAPAQPALAYRQLMQAEAPAQPAVACRQLVPAETRSPAPPVSQQPSPVMQAINRSVRFFRG